MDNLSAFQILPRHIVKLIVNHVAGSSRLQFDDVTTDSDEYKLLQVPLLWVCHNPRVVVHQRFCREYALTLRNDSDSSEAFLSTWPRQYRNHGYYTHHLAKELRFCVDVTSIYSGKALRLLSNAPYEGCAFPLVRKVVFVLIFGDERFYEPVSENLYPLNTVTNITVFAQRVKQMVPAVSEIDVIPDHAINRLLQRRHIHISDLAQHLIGIVENLVVITHGLAPMLMHLDLEPIRDLAHIAFFMDTRFNDVIPLIRRSAHTLEYLDIDVDDVDVVDLIGDPSSGEYLEYPHLHTLKTRSSYSRAPSQKAVFKDIVPFPRLLRLTVLSQYPFGDDVLFRGNAATLEYLTVELLPETVSMLKEYRVFMPTSHPNLKCVKLSWPAHNIPIALATVVEYMQFVLSIAPAASVRVIYSLTRHLEDITPALSLLKNHGSIRILSLSDTHISLWQAISLIKSLPLLSDLHTLWLAVGELPQGVSMTMLPDYVRATFAPMGKQFRCYHVVTGWFTEVKHVEVATCMLLLALACPNFDYTAVRRHHRESFMKAMQEKIDEPEFNQDITRLRRLIFKGWKSC